MILQAPSTNYFNVFGLHIYYYSLCIFFAVLISLFFALHFCAKLSVDKNVVLDFTPRLIIVSIFGARLYYVLLALEYYVQTPPAVLMVWEGGLSIHGAILAGIIFGVFYFKYKKLNFWAYADIFSLVLPLGQAIGRWGNFFNQEAFGRPVFMKFPVVLFIEPGKRPLEYMDCQYFHPAFLYESILDFIIFLILLFLIRKPKKSGIIFFSYIFLYSFIRLFLEFLRTDTVKYFFNIPFPVLVSVFGLLISIFGILRRRRN